MPHAEDIQVEMRQSRILLHLCLNRFCAQLVDKGLVKVDLGLNLLFFFRLLTDDVTGG